ncbi:twin-arginine translocase subunit TatC [Vibrio cholerae]|nr:twin-arginine translocase subunit TatC [Vibrio cholerae]
MSIVECLRSEHIIELKSRTLKSIVICMLAFICLLYFANDIYTFIANPLIKLLPSGTSMIATDVTTPLFSPIKLTMIVSLFISMPFFLYQLWAFITPGLYVHERKIVISIFLSSVILFYVGVAFAYTIVFPIILKFFTTAAPTGVIVSTDISSYLDFALSIMFAFGFAFEIPIIVFTLCYVGVVSHYELREKRPYTIVCIFILSMLVTPPDVFSQTLLAIPVWLLWELGLYISSIYIDTE